MFRVFQYFLYYVEGSLDEYDPTQDMLLRPRAFLTWRRFNQKVPNGAKQYAGANKDREDAEWMIWRFNNQLHFSGVQEWLDNLSHGKTSLGTWEASEYTGIIAKPPVPSGAIYDWKLRKMEDFFRRYLNGQDSRFDDGGGPVIARRWRYVFGWMLPSLLDLRGCLID